MLKKIKIVVADDHEIYREGLRAMLEHEEDIELIGEASDGHQLIDLFENNRPDLAIVDIKMPGMNGIEVTKELKTNYNDAKIIALTMFNNDFLLSEMLNANTNGYLLKTATREEILNATKVVYEGGVFYCRDTAAKLKKHFNQLKANNYKDEKEATFTPREIEIINLICQQLTTKEIATQLNVSERTVDSHRNLILQKIDAKNMVGIVLYAIKHELFKL
jgi:DNA-binding NarL/FixJ family response regulator